MKKVLMALAVAGCFAVPAMAQQSEIKKDHAEWDNKVKTELKLTEEQTVKYDALSKEYNDKFEAIKQDASLSKDAQKEKKMSLKKEKETRLQEFLTPEQQTKYRELMDKKKKSMTKNGS